MLVGGRIIPSFTRNWLVKQGASKVPVPFNRVDVASILLAIAGLAVWVLWPTAQLTAFALLAAGIAQTARLARWAGVSTWREPLVLILHIGYAFVPVGFVLVAAAILWPVLVPQGAALHAWTTGAIGVMTLAVMTRASLGHTGDPLTADFMTKAIYVAILLAALARIAIIADAGSGLLVLAAVGWSAAFLGFAVAYGPKLLRGA
jgi:uncharacterized protein involved in response to NO